MNICPIPKNNSTANINKQIRILYKSPRLPKDFLIDVNKSFINGIKNNSNPKIPVHDRISKYVECE